MQQWPDRDLRVTVVRKATGERLVLDRNGPAGLVDAVAASCAVPGIWPAVTIDGDQVRLFNAEGLLVDTSLIVRRTVNQRERGRA